MQKKRIFTEDQAEEFLSRYVKIAKSKLTTTPDQALNIAKKLKFPLILKIISDKALHKTDIGGVKVCKDEQELQDNYKQLETIAKRRRLKPYQILVQEFVKGKELIIGIKKDPTFQHVIMLGLGGIFVEVLKDVVFRACPITTKDAQEMIDELKAKQILYGTRGQPSININKLKQTLVKVSEIPKKRKNISELDINPLIATENDCIVVDARIVFS
tara:strand:- start:11486 stop:12130 length:645 start_codon:yes stop_codon:yes gene_type:complete